MGSRQHTAGREEARAALRLLEVRAEEPLGLETTTDRGRRPGETIPGLLYVRLAPGEACCRDGRRPSVLKRAATSGFEPLLPTNRRSAGNSACMGPNPVSVLRLQMLEVSPATLTVVERSHRGGFLIALLVKLVQARPRRDTQIGIPAPKPGAHDDTGTDPVSRTSGSGREALALSPLPLRHQNPAQLRQPLGRILLA
jgi:hypothetical protein